MECPDTSGSQRREQEVSEGTSRFPEISSLRLEDGNNAFGNTGARVGLGV